MWANYICLLGIRLIYECLINFFFLASAERTFRTIVILIQFFHGEKEKFLFAGKVHKECNIRLTTWDNARLHPVFYFGRYFSNTILLVNYSKRKNEEEEKGQILKDSSRAELNINETKR